MSFAAKGLTLGHRTS